MDTVSLHKLQLEVSAPTVWSVPKVQPALLTIHLILRNGFGTAANQDALDENTIHYGDLAKRIRAQCQDKPTLEALFPLVETVYSDMALRKDGTCRLSRSMVVINLSQASMHGESCELVDIQDHERNGKSLPSGWQFRIKDIKIMLLIGLKNEERERKQPVVINLDLILDAEKDVSNESITRRNSALFNLERKLIEVRLMLPSQSSNLLTALISSLDNSRHNIRNSRSARRLHCH